ncbi:MAG: hypothetical protein L6Q59_07925, partial [Ignavibacteriaceae bacterium]|nr:hypothetical protein [Ignavibacteriaceae bacterium]
NHRIPCKHHPFKNAEMPILSCRWLQPTEKGSSDSRKQHKCADIPKKSGRRYSYAGFFLFVQFCSSRESIFSMTVTSQLAGGTTGHHSTIMILQRDISNLILGGICQGCDAE